LPSTPHTSTYTGKRVRVVLKDGTVFVDKFVEAKSRTVIFEKHQVTRGEIRSLTIFRQDRASLR
jgi:hypothetical protein